MGRSGKALHWRRRMNGRIEIHARHPFRDDVSLCGCDMSGDTGLGVDESYSMEDISTTIAPINCRHCLGIIEWCRSDKV